MAFYFHVVETDDGHWQCRHGRQVYDQHDTLEQATEHIRHLARDHGPASIFLHHRDGSHDHLEDV